MAVVENHSHQDAEHGGQLKAEAALRDNAASGAEINALAGAPASASFVIGAEAADVINVAIQLLDGDGNDLAEIGHVRAFLSDDSGGDGISGSAPSGGIAIGTDGAIIVADVASLAFQLQSEADGDIDIDITEAGADTWYLVVVLPNGKQVVSGAITFA